MNKINICLTIIIIVLLILFIINLSNYDKFAVITQSNDNPSQTSQINSICEIRTENTCTQGEKDKCIWDSDNHICYTEKPCSDLKNKINCITGGKPLSKSCVNKLNSNNASDNTSDNTSDICIIDNYILNQKITPEKYELADVNQTCSKFCKSKSLNISENGSVNGSSKYVEYESQQYMDTNDISNNSNSDFSQTITSIVESNNPFSYFDSPNLYRSSNSKFYSTNHKNNKFSDMVSQTYQTSQTSPRQVCKCNKIELTLENNNNQSSNIFNKCIWNSDSEKCSPPILSFDRNSSYIPSDEFLEKYTTTYKNVIDNWESEPEQYNIYINLKYVVDNINSGGVFNNDNINYHISDFNTSNVKYMKELLKYKTDFNHDISKWDVSSVTNMKWMF
jgi:hypothetical protein